MRKVVCLIIDVCIVAIAIGCVISGVFTSGFGLGYFRFYTTLSNIFAAVTCALTIPYDVRAIRAGRSGGDASLEMPGWLRTIRLAGFATVMVTFLTVFLFLGFLAGHLALLQRTNFFFHLISPLLMLAGSLLREKSSRLPMCAAVLPIALSVVYGAVYFVEVIVVGAQAGGWDDFYRFNTGGLWPVSMAAMAVAFVLVSLASWRLTRDRGR